MSVSVNIPEITALRSKVEAKYGEPLETHNGFILLVGAIEAEVREHVSESTLERMWGYSTREAASISLRTLNVLSRYVGEASWKGFCEELKTSSLVESEEFSGDSIVTAALFIQITCAMINVWWKISTHTAAIGGVAGALFVFAEFFGFNPVWWLSLTLILAGILGTSRMILRQHSLAQVVAGFFVGGACAIIGILFL